MGPFQTDFKRMPATTRDALTSGPCDGGRRCCSRQALCRSIDALLSSLLHEPATLEPSSPAPAEKP